MEHYLDNSATTRVLPEAAEKAAFLMTEGYGNPSSLHTLGFAARQAVEEARSLVAARLGAEPQEIVFTSGGTESNNLALFGAALARKRLGNKIVTTAAEHDSVLGPCRELAKWGFQVVELKPDRQGRLPEEALLEAIDGETILVSVMLVNNETGAIQPVKEAGQVLRRCRSQALLHTDAIQGFLKIPFTPKALGVDLLTVSGHKIGAMKGSGALYLRAGLRAVPLLRGGGQEKGLRSGTEPTPQIAALAAACTLGKAALEDHQTYLTHLKTYALAAFQKAVPGLVVVAAGDAPHICAISLPGYPSQVVVRWLSDQGFCLSAGSACHRGQASHVYAAMGLSKPVRDGMLRVSFGPENTQEEVDRLAQALGTATQVLLPAGR